MDEKLKYFLYAAQTLSFKKTAEHFYVSATAVSKGVSNLETEIGVKLFDRHNNSIELSKAGRAFYEDTKFLLTDYQNAVAVAQGVTRRSKLAITVGFSSIYEANFLSYLLNGYLRNHSDVEIRLKHRSIEQLEQAVADGTIDVAFTFSDVEQKIPIHSEVLYTGNYVVGISSQNLISREEEITPEQLAHQTVGLYSQYSSELAEKLFIKSLMDRGFTVVDVQQFESYESLMLAVSLNQCVLFIPEIFTNNWNFPGISFVDIKPKFDTYEFVVLTRETHGEQVTTLVSYIEKNIDKFI